MSAARQQPEANSLLNRGLFAFLMLTYAACVYTILFELFALLTARPLASSFDPPLAFNLLVVAVIAGTARPVARWMRDHVSALVFGQYEDSYQLMSEVNRRLQVMTNPALTLQDLVQLLATELHLACVEINMLESNVSWRFTAGAEDHNMTCVRVPINFLQKELGALLVWTRAGDHLVVAEDLALLRVIASQAGMALQAVLLGADLQSSRERLVIARENERRRIRNDLHDELAPTLSSLQLQLGAMSKLLHTDPDQADLLAAELRADLRTATANIRQLVYGLRPPMLDELGLIGAIKSLRINESVPSFEIQSPDPLPVLSAALEVAVYRITAEALHNIVKHAHASMCTISIECNNDWLTLNVTDDGTRLSDEYKAGIGMRSMNERAAELGGSVFIDVIKPTGTRVTARLPMGACG